MVRFRVIMNFTKSLDANIKELCESKMSVV